MVKKVDAYYNTDLGNLYQGKCQDILKQMPDNSIDSLITDPPYGLNFMGKKWDYDVPSVGIWQECLRVLKPGGTALIFAGSRTQHRMACNVEDAGFILKDCIMWIYGSGFPKATDISKQLDKKGPPRKVVGVAGKSGSKRNSMRGDFTGGEYMETAPSTEEAQLWNGWKSHGLKPAYEPILVCMKPNEGSYAQNALKWGVSGLNIDGGRIPTNENLNSGAYSGETGKRKATSFEIGQPAGDYTQPQGRYPANVILDEEVGRLLDKQSGTLKSGDNGGASRFFYCSKASKAERNAGCESLSLKEAHYGKNMSSSDKGTISGSKNPNYNNHPTVKPLSLMQYLCTLTQTPTKGIVLDPFAGSGSTLVACEQLGRSWIGIEKEEEYCQIAKARITREASQLKLFE